MKVFIKTLGCEKNTVDSEFAAGLLVDNGHEIVDESATADVVLINTCGFINDAKEQSISTIFDYISDRRVGQKIVVSGCLSQRYSKELAAEIPEVDAFIGVNNYADLPKIINSFENRVTVRDHEGEYEELGKRIPFSSGYSASIKIAEGCNHICTYCIIPFIRGSFRSRKPENILAEAEMLAKQGVKELVVIAQDVTAYGNDFGQGEMLPDLLRKLCKIDGFKWIRLMYCYEDEITDELIEVIKSEPKICKYLDIPIQHCSNSVLKAMNRRSTHYSIVSTISRLRKQIPDIVIRTTLISGFPGETKEDFDELYEFVSEMRFDRLGVFAYSKEEGTAAARMKNQVRKDVKERRRDKIMSLQREISLELNQKYIGKTLEVLVEEDNEDGTYIGRTFMDAPDIDNAVIFTTDMTLYPGQFVNVCIDDAFDYDLTGHTVN